MGPGLVLAVLLAARTPPAPDPCGDARLVSQGYFSFEGTVLEVVDAVTLLVKVPEAPAPGNSGTTAELKAMSACFGQPCKIRIVNLDPPERPSLAATAQRFMLNQLGKSRRVTLGVSPVQGGEGGAINAVVYPKHYKNGRYDMQELLLEKGLATYRSFGSHAVDWYSECRLNRAEERAKKGHYGLWFAPRNP